MSTHPTASSTPLAAAADGEHDALPRGTRFGEFEILRVLGVGGFGIVYLAHDHSLQRAVALKEYMPASLAVRSAGAQVTVRSSSYAETYAMGLRSFVNEARLLARFDHPSLVKVYRFWEGNATAYMVMPFLQGATLRDARRRMTHPPDEAWVRAIVAPILSALDVLHRQGVYHRDVAPDNILLPRDGPPVLLDLGAARRVIGDRTQSLTAFVKPSYAPIEQYAEMSELRQGPWTDLYALGAVVHFLVYGAPPAPATARAVADSADAAAGREVAGFSPRFLAAMWWMLAVRPGARPQSGEQLRAALDGSAEIPPPGPGVTTLHPPIERSPKISAAPDVPLPAAAPLAATSPPMPASAEPIPKAKRWTRPMAFTSVAAVAIVAIVAAASLQHSDGRNAASEGATPVSSTSSVSAVAAPATVPAEQSTAPFEMIIESAATTAPAAAVAASPSVAETRTRPVGRLALQGDEPRDGRRDAARLRRTAPGGAPATVREACAGRGFIARVVCMDERCEEPQFRAVGECPAILARKRQREH
jgi:serine/threonine protein kinase